ncbi:MAG: hypothetical protein F2579_06440 [Actinobacteria bacterium]|nr:hypothetical protein [Actinomycetota bacterium]
MSVSGLGVVPDVVALTAWVARTWWGPWRAVLSSASAPRVRQRIVHSRIGEIKPDASDVVAMATYRLMEHGGGLLTVPPTQSALNVVNALAVRAPVLVVCPTQRMASMGAAALRRKGFSTAVVPDEWDNALGGVDVVIGARSAVFAPCPRLSAIVVIDEHDESLIDERSPTWDATSVARERAQQAGVPVIATSSVPSAESIAGFSDMTDDVEVDSGWPRISIANLDDIPVGHSLLSSEMMQSISHKGSTTICVLNTKGKARLIVCKSCKAVQRCKGCEALLTQDSLGQLLCERCSEHRGGVCVECGRSAFTVPRGGVSMLRSQLQVSSANPIIEITADSEDKWTKGNVFIGTEAVLYRVAFADCIVFADIDRDLGAPRLSAPREVLSLVARACRTVGATGHVVIQTRQPDHPLMKALGSANVSESLRQWSETDLDQRRALMLPPFGHIARLVIAEPHSIDEVPLPAGVSTAQDSESVLIRAGDKDMFEEALLAIRTTLGAAVRMYVHPRRF